MAATALSFMGVPFCNSNSPANARWKMLGASRRALQAETMARYPDFIERVLLADGLLKILIPGDILNREVWRRIRDADDAAITGGLPIGNPQLFGLVRGGLLYAMDDLDGCHQYFQDEPSDLGSYWHGMMHRREGDFDNARYWFRRSGSLPFFSELHSLAAKFSSDMGKQLSWDPYLFVGQCEQLKFGGEDELGELPRLQRAEFDVAFDYTWRQSKVG
jgi:hypothetical protein